MTCRAHEKTLLLGAHGQLDGVRRLWLEAHLRGCPDCRELWARWVMERDAMRHALAPPDLDPNAERLMTAVAVRIRTEPREGAFAPAPAHAGPRSLVRLLALAALVVVLATAAAAMAVLGPLNAGGFVFVPPAVRQKPDTFCLPYPIRVGPGGKVVIPNLPPAAKPPQPTKTTGRIELPSRFKRPD
jgi:anti-sigma factor RsiW